MEIQSLAQEKNIPVHFEEKDHFDEKFPNLNHQNVYAVVEEKKLLKIEELLLRAFKKSNAPFLIILDRILYPQNMGAILRTAECAGVHGIIIPKNRSARLGSTVSKISAGAVEYLDIAEETNLSSTAKLLKKKGFWIAGAAMDGTPFSETDLTGPLALIVGTEEKGIRPGLLSECDYKISIPLKGKIDSLNASVATGILIYEVLRQRGFDLS
jgi:23S rRNA (guanosine2251-2'-O)-methyltransferase